MRYEIRRTEGQVNVCLSCCCLLFIFVGKIMLLKLNTHCIMQVLWQQFANLVIISISVSCQRLIARSHHFKINEMYSELI